MTSTLSTFLSPPVTDRFSTQASRTSGGFVSESCDETSTVPPGGTVAVL
jgi:hypothetical protein